MANRRQSPQLTHDDPYYVRFSGAKSFDSEKERIWNFIKKELEDQYKARPRDDDIFRFHLFVRQNKTLVLSQIRKEFAVKHPPVVISSESSVALDELSTRIANMPYPVMEKIKKYHRIEVASRNKNLVREVKLLDEIFAKGRPFGLQFVPSQIRSIARPNAGYRKKLFKYPHPDPIIRITMRSIERMKERFLRPYHSSFQRF